MSHESSQPAGSTGTTGSAGAVAVGSHDGESVYEPPVQSSADKELLDFALGTEVPKKGASQKDRSSTSKKQGRSKSEVSGCSPKKSSSSSSKYKSSTSSKPTSSGCNDESSSSSSSSEDILSNDDFDGFWVQVFIVAIVLTIIVVLLQLPAFENWLSCYMTCYEYRLGVRALLFFVFALVILAAFMWFFRC